MKDLTVIVPIHKYDNEIESMLSTALDSINKANEFINDDENNVIIIGPKDILTKLNYDVIKIENDVCDFATQINKAVENVKTKYFSILEFDDHYFHKWFSNVKKYSASYEDVSVYLPLVEVIDKEKNAIVAYSNEAVWASSFSEEIGFLDLESLENFGDFNLTGAIFKKDDFVEVGGLKTSIKLSFWYEFLLRMAYNNKSMFVIPKLGYRHIINREDSLIDIYNKNMKPDEAQWWIDLAKKEYFFKNDRNKTYDGE